MKTLYRQFISATVLILFCSIIVGFALANIIYFSVSKNNIDSQNVEFAQEVANGIENMHDSKDSMHAYLSLIGNSGYQIYLISSSGEKYPFGEEFQNLKIPPETVQSIMDGEIYHGMKYAPSSLLMMGHFSNSLENSVGVPVVTQQNQYALFLRPDNKSIFSDIHVVLMSFVVAIAIISLLGVAVMTRNLIRPISSLTEATKAVKNENFNYRLNISRNDEIGQLAENFNLMQQQLAHNDELRKGFINDVSHDFQSPLMNIQGYSDLLQTDELRKEDRLQYAAIIQRESKRLSNLTKQLLILTSLDQASYSLQRNSVRLDEQLKEIIRKSQWRINERELELSYKLEPVAIQGDAELLMSVWDNLLSNAIKYSELGSIISITCREVHGEIQIIFKDTGIGISNEQLAQIFVRFYRVDTARKKDGTGLGLSIVKKVVELHGGQVNVTSKVGKGSTFVIKLPIRRS